MSTIQSYLQALNESAGSKLGSLEGAEKATLKPLDKKVVDGIEEPEEVSAFTGLDDKQTNEEGVKHNHMSKDNVFEQLYKRAINEDFDEDPAGGGMSNLGGMGDEFGGGMGGDMGGDDMDFGDDEGGEIDSDPDHVGKVKEVVSLLQQALDILTSFESEEEEEYEEYSDEESTDDGDFGDDDFGDEEDEPVTEEENQQFGAAKTIGHALVNREKFIKGQDKKGNMLVKGAVPNVGKKASVPPAGKRDGKLSKFSDAGGKKVQSKGNMKVPGRASNTGKFAFED